MYIQYIHLLFIAFHLKYISYEGYVDKQICIQKRKNNQKQNNQLITSYYGEYYVL
jgi:hypothetical protein